MFMFIQIIDFHSLENQSPPPEFPKIPQEQVRARLRSYAYKAEGFYLSFLFSVICVDICAGFIWVVLIGLKTVFLVL